MNRIKKLYELFEKKENTPKREKILKEIADHPKGNQLAKLVFERADGKVFASAKNQLLPMDDSDEYGPLDHLIEAGDCMRILKLMANDDYVINLLKDDFRAKYDREPNSLSDIARIFSHREEIKKESAVPKAVFESSRVVELGSNWIVSNSSINGIEDEGATLGNYLYVYKILRSSGISLQPLKLPRSLDSVSAYFLFEPFLIVQDHDGLRGREQTYYVFNLLEPSEPARTIKREGVIMYIDSEDTKESPRYKSDLYQNGELRESVLFPIIYQPDPITVFIECVRIGKSSIDVLWKETIMEPKFFIRPRLLLMDHDNLILRIDLNLEQRNLTVNGCIAFHIILSKRRVIRYDLPDISGHLKFGMVEERLGLTIWKVLEKIEDNNDEETSDDDYSDESGHDLDDDNEERHGFYAFGFLSEKEGYEVVCFLDTTHEIGIYHNMLVQDDYDKKMRKGFCVKRLLKHLDDPDQEYPSLSKEINGVTVTKPLIKIESLFLGEFSKNKAKKEYHVMDRSKIACVTFKKRNGMHSSKVEIFI
ncbi:Oidioi.mRNA.OKI2018_I69.chr2.g5679.t1.cds [Oikopleura dioica]|uniref:Oidioi.mRNA.OKI2018_I69.chr2.g5679.t1.cds n=1 Tax=Oikopleura dioica TaxID=34765 RepID=A0ABN7T0R3_OIKDI|nr:Oidioi.mRNA.OKI2018_I69.chr2.g5679.t1.cds [Oikopleura dioica]